MPTHFEIKPNGIILYQSGVITGDELISTNRFIYSQQYDQGLQFQLVILAEDTVFDVSQNDMQTLAVMDRQFIRNKQLGCAVAPTETLYAITKMWCTPANSQLFESHVVKSTDEAIDWLRSKGITVSLNQ